jgi:hypothetical protein
MVDKKIDAIAERREWVEPTVAELPVVDTAFLPNNGSDGNPRFADCTRS